MLEAALSPESPDFPTVAQLWHGAILGTIAHAVYRLREGRIVDEYAWREHVLDLTDYSELTGCVAFTPGRVVGAFFYAESERSPFGEDPMPPYNADTYFAAAPPDVLAIARRDVLPRFLSWLGDPAVADEAFEQGTANELPEDLFAPVITAAFWSEGKTLAAGEPWSAVYEHGAQLLRLELADSEAAIAEWENGMELRPAEVALIRELYERRMADASPLTLTADEAARLTALGMAQLPAVRELLAAVGILLP